MQKKRKIRLRKGDYPSPSLIPGDRHQRRRWVRASVFVTLTVLAILACILPPGAAMSPESSFSTERSPQAWVFSATEPTAEFTAEPMAEFAAESSLAEPAVTLGSSASPQTADQQGREWYAAGRYTEAIAAFEQAQQGYASQGDPLRQAMTLSNLSLAYQQLGQWNAANRAIASSLALLTAELSDSGDRLAVFAQTLDIQGRLQLEQGQAERALATWEQAASRHQQNGNVTGAIASQINQAQAMAALGLYRRAVTELSSLEQTLQTQPDSLVKARGLQTLGDLLRVTGNLEQSAQVLQDSLAVGQRLQATDAVSDALFSLGNTTRAQANPAGAIAYYDQAIAQTSSPSRRIQIQLNRLSLLVESGSTSNLQPLQPLQTLWAALQTQISAQPPSRATVDAWVNLANSLMTLRQTNPSAAPSPEAIAQMLQTATQQAQSLGDARAQSYAYGTLGTLYEQTGQWDAAHRLTEQALLLTQSSNASDISYRWQWQLGRILKAQSAGQSASSPTYQQAIAAYTEAVNTLQFLRSDLVTANTDLQFAFQQIVEPIHRELASLLLTPDDSGSVSPGNLEKARKVIESLQLAELDNFFREACLNARAVDIDQLDPKAAVLYPIILPERLEVILSIPNQPLRHYSTAITSIEVEATTGRLRQTLTDRLRQRFMPSAQQVYDWLIRPAEADLAEHQISTLVFVLDGVLRNIPMAALHDGNQFLVERFSIALTPGLQLLSAKPLQEERFSILAAGLTEERQGFSSLPSVANELQEIEASVPSRILLNQDFTAQSFRQYVSDAPSPVVHLATHGQFSSNVQDTYILTWDGRINITQLNQLLQNSDLNRDTPIELLVLSACQTAVGDKRAALGLAGVAVRAGARSTIASLWSVDDQATSAMMVQFYDGLGNQKLTKAEALRQAQLSILENPQYRRHPYYWSAFVLVGNWL